MIAKETRPSSHPPAKPAHETHKVEERKGGVAKKDGVASKAPVRGLPPDEPDEDQAAKDAAEKARIRRSLWRRLLLLLALVLVAGIAAHVVIEYRAASTEAKLAARISAAIAAHTLQHAQDGKGYDEVALVDWVRRCLSTTLASPDYVSANGLPEASGQTIVSTAEKSCLRSKLVDIATKEIISQESARLAGDDQAAAIAIRKLDDELHFVVAFARLHGYAIPEEFQIFQSDYAILKTFDSTRGATPAPEKALPSWQR